MTRLAAKAFFKAGEHARAAELSRRINQQWPTVDTLLLEAKLKRQRKNFNSAIELLKTAEQTLSDSHIPSDYSSPFTRNTEVKRL